MTDSHLTVGKLVYASIELVENLCARMLKPAVKKTGQDRHCKGMC